MSPNTIKKNTLALFVGITMCTPLSSGCKSDDPGGGGEGGTGETGGGPDATAFCYECAGLVEAACFCIKSSAPGDFNGEGICVGEDPIAYEQDFDQCELELGHTPSPTEYFCIPRPPCESPDVPTTGEPAYSCEYWDPDSKIGTYMGVYSIDATLVTDLVNDATPLTACDDATVEPLVSAPGFAIANADNGEMLYELGLRNGDIPLELNGYPLETYTDAWTAFIELWVIEQETDYELDILRGTSPMTLMYGIYFVKGS